MAKSANACVLWACSWLLLSVSQGAMAIGVSIRGVIVAPPACIVNGGGTLNVPFGSNLITTRIDGVNYRRSVPYTVTCTGGPSNGMSIRLQGVSSGFDGTVLATNNNDLGIKLFINGAAWPLNNAVSFTYPILPAMEAVPVKRPAATLHAGTFSTSATLVVVLQ